MPFDAMPGHDEDPGMRPDPVLALLEEGRRKIAAGWIKKRYVDHVVTGWFWNRKRRYFYCAVGALGFTKRTDVFGFVSDIQEQAASQLANAVYGDDFFSARLLIGDLIEWNDAPARTQDDVLAAFDQAIEARRRALVSKGALA